MGVGIINKEVLEAAVYANLTDEEALQTGRSHNDMRGTNLLQSLKTMSLWQEIYCSFWPYNPRKARNTPLKSVPPHLLLQEETEHHHNTTSLQSPCIYLVSTILWSHIENSCCLRGGFSVSIWCWNIWTKEIWHTNSRRM